MPGVAQTEEEKKAKAKAYWAKIKADPARLEAFKRRAKAWREANPEKKKAYTQAATEKRRARRAADPDYVKRESAKRYAKHKAKLAAMSPEERADFRASLRERQRKWEKTPSGKASIAKSKKQAAARRAAMSPEEVLSISRKAYEKRKADPEKLAQWLKKCRESRERAKAKNLEALLVRESSNSKRYLVKAKLQGTDSETKKRAKKAAKRREVAERVKEAGLFDQAQTYLEK